ncbi:MAG: hypothetical protein HY823_01435 [Acidobacteria bacterium]|nr:hypothetical protein [Acidobacteriota bacterium]
MIPAAPPPLQAPPPTRAALDSSAATHARALEALRKGLDPPGSRALRGELRAALATRERHLGRFHPLSLGLRGLLGLVLDRGSDARGLGYYAAACGELHRQLRLQQRARGTEARELLPYLDALAELYAAESMSVDPWEEAAIRISMAHSLGPRPDLERRVVAALERHYGGWLSFRPPDREGVLKDAGHLVTLWLRRGDRDLTGAFAEVAFRSGAAGVWRLVGREGDPSLRGDIAELLGRLDPEILREHFQPFRQWLEQSLEGPWRDSARKAAHRLDRALEASPAGVAGKAIQRARLASALEDPAGAERILAEALSETREPPERRALLSAAEKFLEGREAPLLEAALEEALRVDLRAHLADPEGRAAVLGQAQRLERGGRLEAAEPLWKSLLGASGADPGGASFMPSREVLRRLGDNLRAQGRWAEARFHLEALLAIPEGEADPTLHFALCEVEQRMGNADMARERARNGLARIPPGDQLQPMPGLALALRCLEGDGATEGLRNALSRRLRKALDPEGRLPALAQPAVLLSLVEALGAPPRSEGGEAPCGGPWREVARGPVERAQALLRASRDLPLRAARPCRQEALALLEKAWGPEDLRLLETLVSLGGSENDPDQAEPLLRRALELGRAHPEAEPALVAEALGRLGTLLGEAGREGESLALLRGAMPLFSRANLGDEKVRDTAGGVFLALLAMAEYREDYSGALALADEAEQLMDQAGIRDRGDLPRLRARLERQARVQALLRAQGLP